MEGFQVRTVQQGVIALFTFQGVDHSQSGLVLFTSLRIAGQAQRRRQDVVAPENELAESERLRPCQCPAHFVARAAMIAGLHIRFRAVDRRVDG